MGNTKLKPCPFCGGDARLVLQAERRLNGARGYYVECYECSARSLMHPCEDICVDKWNTRHQGGDTTEMVQGETLTTKFDWEQRLYECVKDLVANRVENGKPVSVGRAVILAKRIREELSIK